MVKRNFGKYFHILINLIGINYNGYITKKALAGCRKVHEKKMRIEINKKSRKITVVGNNVRGGTWYADVSRRKFKQLRRFMWHKI